MNVVVTTMTTLTRAALDPGRPLTAALDQWMPTIVWSPSAPRVKL